jgi:hypothetical protein
MVPATSEPTLSFPLPSIEKSVTINSYNTEEKSILELRGVENDISEAIIRILFILRMSQNCYLFINDRTLQVAQANPNGDFLNYVSTRTFSELESDQFKRHGVIGEDRNQLNDVSFMRHGMKPQDVINHMINNGGEL